MRDEMMILDLIPPLLMSLRNDEASLVVVTQSLSSPSLIIISLKTLGNKNKNKSSLDFTDGAHHPTASHQENYSTNSSLPDVVPEDDSLLMIGRNLRNIAQSFEYMRIRREKKMRAN